MGVSTKWYLTSSGQCIQCYGANRFTSLSVLALDRFVTGATGWISGNANVIAAQSVALFDPVTRQGDLDVVRAVFRAIHPFVTYAETSEHGI